MVEGPNDPLADGLAALERVPVEVRWVEVETRVDETGDLVLGPSDGALRTGPDPGRGRRLLLAAAVITTGLVASAVMWPRDGTDQIRTGPVSPEVTGSGATELPASFRNGDLVATAGHVVNLGPGAMGMSSGPSAAVDLITGATRALDAPPPIEGRRFLRLGSVGLTDEVLVVGQDCLEPFDVEEGCDAEEYRILLLDPADGSWRPTTLPPLAHPAQSVALLQALPGGGAIADLRIDGNRRSVIVVLEGDTWRQVGDVRDDSFGLACATATELFEFDEEGAEQTPQDREVGVERVGFRATATSLSTGEVRELRSPEADGSYQGIGVEVACGEQIVALATKGPGLSGPGGMVVLDGQDWSEEIGVFDPLTPVAATDSWSGGPKPLLAVTVLPERPPPGEVNSDPRPGPLVLSSIDADGRPKLVTSPEQLIDRSVLQLGPTGQLLILGPSTPPTELDETPEADMAIPITVMDLD